MRKVLLDNNKDTATLKLPKTPPIPNEKSYFTHSRKANIGIDEMGETTSIPLTPYIVMVSKEKEELFAMLRNIYETVETNPGNFQSETFAHHETATQYYNQYNNNNKLNIDNSHSTLSIIQALSIMYLNIIPEIQRRLTKLDYYGVESYTSAPEPEFRQRKIFILDGFSLELLNNPVFAELLDFYYSQAESTGVSVVGCGLFCCNDYNYYSFGSIMV